MAIDLHNKPFDEGTQVKLSLYKNFMIEWIPVFLRKDCKFRRITGCSNAREFAFGKGLNPRDIHLKNILLLEGRAKIIDVSEYMKPGNDKRWEYLKEGYRAYYHLIDGKALPYWIIETLRKWFNQAHSQNFNSHEFVKELVFLFRFGRSDFHHVVNSQR
jgi:hypothetical protein